MKLIVGLGNPGKKYSENRHNLGYMVADAFSVDKGLGFAKSEDLMCFYVKTQDFVLAKPTTFMNESGNSVRALAKFFKIDHEDVLIAYDDMDIPFGKIRMAFNGTSAGHHGIDSVIECMATVDFGRLRVGIGRPSPKATDDKRGADHVLDDFTAEEKKVLDDLMDKCVDAIDSYLDDGILATMNRFN
jgi:PTH1 family peptidyl-tRNA hydrolase